MVQVHVFSVCFVLMKIRMCPLFQPKEIRAVFFVVYEQPSSFKNTIPVILSDVDPKFNSKVKLMSELKQFHLNIKVSKVLERKNNSFLIIGDTPRDVRILQSESKMKACPGQKVKISLPKAYQTAKPKKSLTVKGVPAEVTKQEFKERKLKDLLVKRW